MASANNLLVNAANLANGTTQVTGNTATDTQEAGEFRLSSNGTTASGQTGLHTVWFRWKAPSATNATFTTVGTGYDTYLSVYKATAGQQDPVSTYSQLTPVASDDDAGGGAGTSSVTITPTSGVIYYLQFSGFSASDSGAFTLNYPSPATISFSSAAIAGTPQPYTARFRAANW